MSERIKAKIFKSGKRIFTCKLESTGELVEATAMRELIKGKKSLVAGDNVYVGLGNTNQYEILESEERKNEIFRKLVRDKKKKVIASNVDVMLIVSSLSLPEYKSRLIDRYLIRAAQWDLPVIIVFNKKDEFKDTFDLDYEMRKFDSLGVNTIMTNATDFNDQAILALKETLIGKTAILLGQSGVGKSKIITAISNGDVQLRSEKLAKVGKGAHTTTWAEILDCGPFYMIDSPGIRTLAVSDLTKEELIACFPDLYKVFETCQFSDCTHENNAKGCGFHQLDDNILDHQFLLERLHSYLRMRDEIESVPEWEKY